jgi:hypothetical protein
MSATPSSEPARCKKKKKTHYRRSNVEKRVKKWRVIIKSQRQPFKGKRVAQKGDGSKLAEK